MAVLQVYTALALLIKQIITYIFSPNLQIDDNKSHGWTFSQIVDQESHVRKDTHVTLFKHQRVYS